MGKLLVHPATPVPSQRSVVCAAELAQEINLAYRSRLFQSFQNGPHFDINDELWMLWWKLLYQNDFEDWMVTHAGKTFGFAWLDVLVKLRNQSFFYSYGNPYGGVVLPEIPEDHRSQLSNLGNYYLSRLIALFLREATDPVYMFNRTRLLRSLELDGISTDLKNLQLLQNEGPISLDDERTELESLLEASGLPDRTTTKAHLKSASEHYLNGEDHSSLGESRTFFQSLLDQVTDGIGIESGKQVPAGTKNRAEFLMRAGFFTSDEESAFRAAWGFLSSGNHPGLPERVLARLGMVLALEFGQALLVKWSNRGGYSQ
jgi:hypothetical protein